MFNILAWLSLCVVGYSSDIMLHGCTLCNMSCHLSGHRTSWMWYISINSLSWRVTWAWLHDFNTTLYLNNTFIKYSQGDYEGNRGKPVFANSKYSVLNMPVVQDGCKEWYHFIFNNRIWQSVHVFLWLTILMCNLQILQYFTKFCSCPTQIIKKLFIILSFIKISIHLFKLWKHLFLHLTQLEWHYCHCWVLNSSKTNIPMSAAFIIVVIVVTWAHDLAVCYEAGAQLWVVALLQRHQHAYDLSCDEGIIEALIGHRPQGEFAPWGLHCSLGVWWLQRLHELHELNVGIVDLHSQIIHEQHLIWHELRGINIRHLPTACKSLRMTTLHATYSGHPDNRGTSFPKK